MERGRDKNLPVACQFPMPTWDLAASLEAPVLYDKLPLFSVFISVDFFLTCNQNPKILGCIKLCVCARVLSHVQLFATPWTVAHQAPLSIGFSRQEILE